MGNGGRGTEVRSQKPEARGQMSETGDRSRGDERALGADSKKAARSGGLRLNRESVRASATRDGANRRERVIGMDNLVHRGGRVGGWG
jgi:hypothetical protein